MIFPYEKKIPKISLTIRNFGYNELFFNERKIPKILLDITNFGYNELFFAGPGGLQ